MDFEMMLAEACAKADAAACEAKAKYGDVGSIGDGYVVIPLKQRKLVKFLMDNKERFGSGFKSDSGWWRGYQWNPRTTSGLGQAAHIYIAAAEAAEKVLKEYGVPDVTVREYYD